MAERNGFLRRWNATSDFPIRSIPRAAFLIDGRMTMLQMCCHMLRATETISITAWGLFPEFLLVRGKYKRAGEDGSAEQEELLTWLSGNQLGAEELRFWVESEELSVEAVLGYAVRKGVDVRVILWDTYTVPFHRGPGQICEELEKVGVRCQLDNSHMGVFKHPTLAHHQKSIVIDGTYAFVGGIDMMSEAGGEYDRWDTKGHPYHSPLRLDKAGKMPHSWHDVHVLIEGEAVADVEQNFRQRWNSLVNLHQDDASLLLDDISHRKTLSAHYATYLDRTNKIPAQVVRTIPKEIYPFASEEGIATILDSYLHAIDRAKQFIYIENQYFWRRAYLGIDEPALGLPNQDMEKVIQALARALERGVLVTLILPDHPNVGREFTDEGIRYLRELAPRAAANGALQTYTLGSSGQKDDATLYRSIYVHAKVAIIDDFWVTVGSANLNNRGMRDDTELNVTITHPDIAQGLRILLMAEHLGLYDEEVLFRMLEVTRSTTFLHGTRRFRRWLNTKVHLNNAHLATTIPTLYANTMPDDLVDCWTELQEQVGDPFKGIGHLAKQAQMNYQAVKNYGPLIGHLLPYIPFDLIDDYEVDIHASNGWLDALPDP